MECTTIKLIREFSGRGPKFGEGSALAGWNQPLHHGESVPALVCIVSVIVALPWSRDTKACHAIAYLPQVKAQALGGSRSIKSGLSQCLHQHATFLFVQPGAKVCRQ